MIRRYQNGTDPEHCKQHSYLPGTLVTVVFSKAHKARKWVLFAVFSYWVTVCVSRGVPRILPGGMHIFGWPTPPPPGCGSGSGSASRFWAGSGSESKQCVSTALGSAVKRLLSNLKLCLGKQTCIFFLLPTASSFLITSLSGWGGGGDAHGRGGCTGGGRGDARVSCASPLGTPLCVRYGIVLMYTRMVTFAGGSNPSGKVRGPLRSVAGTGRWFCGGAASQRAGRVSLLQGRGRLWGPPGHLSQAGPDPRVGHMVPLFRYRVHSRGFQMDTGTVPLMIHSFLRWTVSLNLGTSGLDFFRTLTLKTKSWNGQCNTGLLFVV